jgi:dTDP-4-amino-4,6-dideoxygalactose transaminase
MDAICDLAAQHKLQIIEDCAHAVEASYRGRLTGTMGDYGCFSFYATKNVTSGEGGMAIARDPERAQYMKMLSSHGISSDAFNRFSKQTFKHYEVMGSGFMYKMMDLQAAIAIHQLNRVESGWERRSTIWSRYQQAFKDFPLALPTPSPPHVRHAYHLYTVLLNEQAIDVSRDQFLLSMTQQGVGVGIHYPALTEHPFYQRKLGWNPENTPHATRIGRQTVSLPISPKLTDEEVQRVITAVATALTTTTV